MSLSVFSERVYNGRILCTIYEQWGFVTHLNIDTSCICCYFFGRITEKKIHGLFKRHNNNNNLTSPFICLPSFLRLEIFRETRKITSLPAPITLQSSPSLILYWNSELRACFYKSCCILSPLDKSNLVTFP